MSDYNSFENIFNKNYEAKTTPSDSWKNLVGKEMAEHSKIKEIKNHNLIIYVDHQVWYQQLLFMKPKILEYYNKNFRELYIEKISCVINKLKIDEFKPTTQNFDIEKYNSVDTEEDIIYKDVLDRIEQLGKSKF